MTSVHQKKVLGFWLLPGAEGVQQFGVTRKPHAFHRAMMRICFGWQWMDKELTCDYCNLYPRLRKKTHCEECARSLEGGELYNVIKLAEKAGIVFGMNSTEITVQKLEKFFALARGLKSHDRP
jgi:hypothetical protein